MTPPDASPAARNDNVAQATTLGELLIAWVRRAPGRRILVEEGRRGAPPRSWTCEALRDDAAVLALALLSRFSPGERIAVRAPACPEAVLLRFAAAFAGLILVILDPEDEVGDVARVVGLSGSVGVFGLSGAGGPPQRRLLTTIAPAVREVVDLSDRRALFAKRHSVEGLPEVTPDDLAELRYVVTGAGLFSAEPTTHRERAASIQADSIGFWQGPLFVARGVLERPFVAVA